MSDMDLYRAGCDEAARDGIRDLHRQRGDTDVEVVDQLDLWEQFGRILAVNAKVRAQRPQRAIPQPTGYGRAL